MSKLLGALVATSLLAAPAWAGKDKEKKKDDQGAGPPVEVEAEFFAHAGVNLTEGSGAATEFAIDRTYLTAFGDAGPKLAYRLTLDSGREEVAEVEVDEATGAVTQSTREGRLRVFVKHAYLEWKTPADGVKMRFGAAATPMCGYYDKFWGHRYVTPSHWNKVRLLDTADLGVHALGKHKDGLLDWQAALVNGEGFGRPEGSGRPTAQGRLTVNPLAGKPGKALPLTGFVSYDVPAEGEDARLVYVGAAGFSVDFLLLWVDYTGVKEGDQSTVGYSATLVPRARGYGDLFVTYAHWDWDSDAAEDETTRLLAGVSHDFSEQVALAAVYERSYLDSLPEEASQGAFLYLRGGF